MWGITIYLMRLADHLQMRKDKRTCRICNYVAKNENAINEHMQKEHRVLMPLICRGQENSQVN